MWYRSGKIEFVPTVDSATAHRIELDFRLFDDNGPSRPFAAIQRKIGHGQRRTDRFVHLSHSASGRLSDLQVSSIFVVSRNINSNLNLVQSNACPVRRRSTPAAAIGTAFSENIQHEIRHNISNYRNDHSRRSECANQIVTRSNEKTIKIGSRSEGATHTA